MLLVLENFEETTKIPSILSLAVVVVVVVMKLILARYLIRQGQELDSEIIRASGKESMTDVFSSIIVFVGILGVLIGNQMDAPSASFSFLASIFKLRCSF